MTADRAREIIAWVARLRQQRAFKTMDPTGEMGKRALALAEKAEAVLRSC